MGCSESTLRNRDCLQQVAPGNGLQGNDEKRVDPSAWSSFIQDPEAAQPPKVPEWHSLPLPEIPYTAPNPWGRSNTPALSTPPVPTAQPPSVSTKPIPVTLPTPASTIQTLAPTVQPETLSPVMTVPVLSELEVQPLLVPVTADNISTEHEERSVPFELVKSVWNMEGHEEQAINFTEDESEIESSDNESLINVIYPGRKIYERMYFRIRKPIQDLRMVTTLAIGERDISRTEEKLGDFVPRDDLYEHQFKYPAITPEQLCFRYHVFVEFFSGSTKEPLYGYWYILAGPMTLEKAVTYRQGAPERKTTFTADGAQLDDDEEDLVLKIGTVTSSKISFFANTTLKRLQCIEDHAMGTISVGTFTYPLEGEYLPRKEPYEYKFPESKVSDDLPARRLQAKARYVDGDGMTVMAYSYKFTVKKEYPRSK